MKRKIAIISAIVLMLACGTIVAIGQSKRLPVEQRLFCSQAIDQKIEEIKQRLGGSPYLAWMFENCFLYQNTRRFVWSEDNPSFFRGTAGEGIGGPHIGYDMPWHMSIMMYTFTSSDDAEIKRCIEMLMATDAGTGFIHESFHKDDATRFTRPWFAWQNSLFGELILKLLADGKADLLNSCRK